MGDLGIINAEDEIHPPAVKPVPGLGVGRPGFIIGLAVSVGFHAIGIQAIINIVFAAKNTGCKLMGIPGPGFSRGISFERFICRQSAFCGDQDGAPGRISAVFRGRRGFDDFYFFNIVQGNGVDLAVPVHPRIDGAAVHINHGPVGKGAAGSADAEIGF